MTSTLACFFALCLLAAPAPANAERYLVKSEYASSDSNCAGTPTRSNAQIVTEAQFMIMMSVSQGGTSSCPLQSGITMGASTVQSMRISDCMMSYYSDTTCSTSVGSPMAWQPSCYCEGGSCEMQNCTATKPSTGNDMTCLDFAAANRSRQYLPSGPGMPPCASTCSGPPDSCNSYTTMFGSGGCGATCSANLKSAVAANLIQDSSNTVDCSCSVVASNAPTTSPGSASAAERSMPCAKFLLVASLALAASGIQ